MQSKDVRKAYQHEYNIRYNAISSSGAEWLSMTLAIEASLSVYSVIECWDGWVKDIMSMLVVLLWYNNITMLLSLSKHNASMIWWQEFRVSGEAFIFFIGIIRGGMTGIKWD